MNPNIRLGAVLALSLAVLLPASAALAKGPPDKLAIVGPGLAGPIEITDAATVSGFSPWTRGFIAWDRGVVAEPPPAEQRYAVSFYVKNREGEFSLIYVLEYVPDPSGGPGYISIPGPGDPWYRLNIGTIITGSSDRWDPNGKWQYATTQWDTVMHRALRAHGVTLPVPASLVPSTAPAPIPSAAEPVPGPAPAALSAIPMTIAQPWVVALPAIGLMSGLAWAIRRRRRKRPV